jgi:hypothetical protein
VSVAAVAATTLAVLLHQHSRGRIALAIEHRALPLASMRVETGQCWIATLGTDWLSSHARPSPARLLEDGHDLGPANALHEQIRSRGGGRFSIWHGQLYFSTSDGSDPSQNGRRYEIVWPTPIAAGWRHACTALAVLLVGLTLLFGRSLGLGLPQWIAHRVVPRVVALVAFVAAADGRRAWRMAALVAAVAIFVRAVDHLLVMHDLAGHISGGLVMGVPFSDAQGWDNQGESIMGGHGLVGMWSARRPFYAFVLGALYTWTGPSAFAVVVLHMLVGGLTAALVCRIGQRAIHPVVGLIGGIAFAFDPVSIEYSEFVLTETMGTFLFVLSVHQLVVAVQEDRAAAAWWAGVAFTLSNLTRTLTLPAMPLLVLLLWWIGSRRQRGWRRGFWLAVLFSIGFALPLGTWIVRQKIVHGLTTISDNTASGLYAAASPKYGTWSSYVDREAEEAGIETSIKPRYEWFMQRFRAELAADPWVYVRNVLASAGDALRGLGDVPKAVRGLLVLLLLGIWLSRLPGFGGSMLRAFAWTAAAALAIYGACTMKGFVAAGIGIAGLMVASWVRRDRIVLLALAGHVGTVAAVALFALGSDSRLLLMVSWLQPIGQAILAGALMELVARRIGRPGRPAPLRPVVMCWAPRWQLPVVRVMLVFAAANLGWLAWRNYAAPAAMLPPLPRPTVTAAQALVDRFAELRPDLIAPEEQRPEAWYRHAATVAGQVEGHGRWIVANARLSRHRYTIGAEVRVQHWSRMFDPRPYSRTFTYAETALPDGPRGPACILFANPAPPAAVRDVALVGRSNVDTNFVIEECYLEVLAWMPIALDGSFDLAALQIVQEPAHAALVDGLRAATPK